MTRPLTSMNIAILAANGFDENPMTALQRALTVQKVPYKVVAPEQGLVNGWQDKGWGHYFTVDAPIASALGSDYDVLVLVGGERGVAKLKTNLHTRRIINHFLEAEKPIAAIGCGAALLALSPKSAGRCVAASDDAHADLTAAQMEISPESQTRDGMILSADGSDIDTWVEAALVLFSEAPVFEDEEPVAA